MESFGLSREDAQVRNKFEERNRAGKKLRNWWLAEIYLQKTVKLMSTTCQEQRE